MLCKYGCGGCTLQHQLFKIINTDNQQSRFALTLIKVSEVIYSPNKNHFFIKYCSIMFWIFQHILDMEVKLLITVFSRAFLLAEVQHVKRLGEQGITNFVYMQLASTISPASWYQQSNHRIYYTPSSLHTASSFVLTLAKVRNFERVASKTQRVHATAFSCLHERCQ